LIGLLKAYHTRRPREGRGYASVCSEGGSTFWGGRRESSVSGGGLGGFRGAGGWTVPADIMRGCKPMCFLRVTGLRRRRVWVLWVAVGARERWCGHPPHEGSGTATPLIFFFLVCESSKGTQTSQRNHRDVGFDGSESKKKNRRKPKGGERLKKARSATSTVAVCGLATQRRRQVRPGAPRTCRRSGCCRCRLPKRRSGGARGG